MRKIIILSLFLSSNYVLAQGNINYYPKHNCQKPFNIEIKKSENDKDFEKKNKEVSKYIKCLSDYVEKATNDMEKIQKNIQDAIEDVREIK